MTPSVPFKKPSFFKYRILVLRWMGCWPKIEKDKTIGEIIYCICTVLMLINVAVACGLSFISTVFVVTQGEINEKGVNHIINSIIAFQILSKAVVTATKSQKMQKLVDDLNNYFYKTYCLTDSDTEIVRKCYNYDKKLAIFFCVLSTLITVINTVKPLIVTLARSYRMRAENTSALILGDFPTKYPFQYEATSIWYWFWFIQQITAVYPAAMASWCSDSMFCAFLYYLCGHFDILISNISSDHGSGDTTKDRFSRELTSTFAPLMVIQLLLGAVTIGCLMIQLVLIEGRQPLQYNVPIMYLTLKLLQLYILCWHGQLLLDKSVAVSEAIFFSSWYNKSKECCKDLRIIMIRSRKPIKFAYAGIFQLSAKRYASILNAAYGYFTLMNTAKHV